MGPRLPEDLTGYDQKVKAAVESFNRFYANFNVMFMGRSYQVLKNEDFLQLASLVYDYTVVDSAEEALSRILSSSFKPGSIVLLEEKPEVILSDGKGEVNIDKIIANEKVLNVKTDTPAFLIIRENFHPDWKCYIDGKKEKVYKANYIFYGVFVPSGNHTVQFVYESKVFNIAALISFLGFSIFIVSLLIVYVKKTKGRVD
jgi:hypothetical protein